MATKDFMAPKQPAPNPQDSNDCGTRVYGRPSRPAAAASAENAAPVKKQSVNNSSVAGGGGGSGIVSPPFEKPKNAYTHSTDNVVVNSKERDTSDNFDRVDLNLQFQPNILDTFDVVTYNFKLFITDPDTSSTGAVFDTDKQVIIAQSGVTDLTIDKVELRSIATPSVEAGTGTSTNIKFEITEPAGAGLVDKIFYQSVALGIGNWAVMPVYLQLQFRGRDPLSSAPEDGAPGSLSALKWLWAMKISTIKANVTHVGTRYEFEAVLYNEFAQSNAIFELKHNVTLSNVETFADAMKELQDKLNADELLKLISTNSIPDSYKIVVDPKIAGYKITPPEKNTNSRRNDGYTGEQKNASFVAGTSVDKIIDTLLSQTEEYQKSMLGAPTAGSPGASMNQLPSQMKEFWRIATETRPLKFDALRTDIAKEFTIFVFSYDIGVLDSNVSQTSSTPDTIAAQRKRLMTYVKKSILKKKYNYIFTGLNDQVINFDITINNAFANAQSRLGGIYLNYAMADKGVVNHNHAEDEASVQAALTKAISFQNSAKTANTTAAKTAMEDARNSIASSNLPNETKQRYQILLEQSKPDSRLNYLANVQSAGGITVDGSLNSARSRATILSTPIEEKITGKQLNFISGVDPTSAAAKEAYSSFIENIRGKIHPIARAEAMQDRQVGPGVESSSNSGIQKLSSMFSVALHSGLDSSLQRIKLTIKGDPFWVFPQPYRNDNERVFNSLKAPAEAIDWIKNAHTKLVDSANLYGTDNFILIRFRTPKIYESLETDVGSDGNVDVETLSGIYRVNTIVSRFEGGKFVQELDCMLDPEISILNISDQIEANAAEKDKVPTAADLTQGVNIPSSAISKDRIMGAVTDAQGRVTTAVASAQGAITARGVELQQSIPQPSLNSLDVLPNRFG